MLLQPTRTSEHPLAQHFFFPRPALHRRRLSARPWRPQLHADMHRTLPGTAASRGAYVAGGALRARGPAASRQLVARAPADAGTAARPRCRGGTLREHRAEVSRTLDARWRRGSYACAMCARTYITCADACTQAFLGILLPASLNKSTSCIMNMWQTVHDEVPRHVHSSTAQLRSPPRAR